jgi:hypothetical protein
MGVAGLTMIVLPRGVIMLAFKCLRFSGLALFHLRLMLRGSILRIVDCVAFCCVVQVISLSSAAVACSDDEKHGKTGISGTYPKQSV